MITRLGNHHVDGIPRDSRGAVGSMQRMSAVIAPHRWRFGKKSSRNGRCAILRGGLEHLFFSIYWESSSRLTNIFQRGWNHQPALLCLINMGDVPVVSSLIPISSLKWPGDFGATPFSWLAARDLALSLSQFTTITSIPLSNFGARVSASYSQTFSSHWSQVFVAYKVQAMTLNSTSRSDSRLLEDALLILESWLCLTGTAADYQHTGSGCFISCAWPKRTLYDFVTRRILSLR